MDRTRPTLNQINIVCGNLDASIAFYRRSGLAVGLMSPITDVHRAPPPEV